MGFNRFAVLVAAGICIVQTDVGLVEASSDSEPFADEVPIETRRGQILEEGYTLVPLEPREDDPRRSDIYDLFLAPYLASIAPRHQWNPEQLGDFGFHDINGDGHEELFIKIRGGCEYDGCHILGYSTRDGSTWQRILDTAGLDIAVASNEGNEYPPITMLSPTFDHHYVYTNGAYEQVVR